MNYWGHILVGDPAGFRRKVEVETSDTSDQLIEFSRTVPPRRSACRVRSHEEYETAYHSNTRVAFERQNSLDDELVAVLRLLRSHVSQIEALLCIGSDFLGF